MSGETLFVVYCFALMAISLLRLALQFLSKENYYSAYKKSLDLLEWFFLGGAVFYCITVWPW